MRRRHFLSALAIGPWWLGRAFADASLRGGSSASGIDAARIRAQASVRGVLIIIVPETDAKKSEWGGAWGEYLNHASDVELAPLHYVDVACASARSLKLAREPFAALLDVDGKLTEADGGDVPSNVVNGRWVAEDQEEALIGKRIGVVADKVAQLVRRSKQLQLVSPTTPREAATEVRKRLVEAPPPGSHWATHSMCGYPHVEGLVDKEAEEKISMDCGMGAISDRSSRFLYFYTKTPQRRALGENG